jgi:protein-S-isoprenylcysteine O-methyltransferase Ste14
VEQDKDKRLYDRLKPWALATAGSLFTVAQIVLSFVFYNKAGSDTVANIGWGVLVLSAIFGWLPIFTFRARGGVAKGESYIQTTKLVTGGIYAVVRHPQFLAGMLINVALPLITQHWLIAVLGVPPFVLMCLDARTADLNAIKKFGEDYQRYMERVPRLNFLVGIVRLLARGRSKEDAP